MENKVSLWKNSINYGLIGGILMIAFSLILWLLDLIEVTGLGMVGYLILALAMFIAMQNWRDKFNGGWMSYGEAFKTGFYVTIIAAVLGVLYQYVFLNFIDPDFLVNQLAKTEETILESNPNISDEDLDRTLEMTANLSSPMIVTVMSLVVNIIMGVIIAVVVALFAKKVDPAQEI